MASNIRAKRDRPWTPEENKQLLDSVKSRGYKGPLYPCFITGKPRRDLHWKNHPIEGRTPKAVMNHFYKAVNPLCCHDLSDIGERRVYELFQNGETSCAKISKILFEENQTKCKELGSESYYFEKGKYLSDGDLNELKQFLQGRSEEARAFRKRKMPDQVTKAGSRSCGLAESFKATAACADLTLIKRPSTQESTLAISNILFLHLKEKPVMREHFTKIFLSLPFEDAKKMVDEFIKQLATSQYDAVKDAIPIATKQLSKQLISRMPAEQRSATTEQCVAELNRALLLKDLESKGVVEAEPQEPESGSQYKRSERSQSEQSNPRIRNTKRARSATFCPEDCANSISTVLGAHFVKFPLEKANLLQRIKTANIADANIIVLNLLKSLVPLEADELKDGISMIVTDLRKEAGKPHSSAAEESSSHLDLQFLQSMYKDVEGMYEDVNPEEVPNLVDKADCGGARAVGGESRAGGKSQDEIPLIVLPISLKG
ncbi:MAG: hypothetical protein P0S95_02510 [Rhabdochlamydiaceae bacterium]|nr:hypothetical protein [Candidatus Amphrikana amoebophyrae]